MSDTATLLTALATLITACTAFASVIINGRRIQEVKHEVKTGNSQTLAQLADAVETRRVDEIPKKDRTPLEQSHIADVVEVE